MVWLQKFFLEITDTAKITSKAYWHLWFNLAEVYIFYWWCRAPNMQSRTVWRFYLFVYFCFSFFHLTGETLFCNQSKLISWNSTTLFNLYLKSPGRKSKNSCLSLWLIFKLFIFIHNKLKSKVWIFFLHWNWNVWCDKSNFLFLSQKESFPSPQYANFLYYFLLLWLLCILKFLTCPSVPCGS